MSKMILIIEDEESIQNIIKAFLEDAGYTVVLAADGMEGIEQFRANKPELVLLDLMLPKIDGFAVCEILRKESHVPIIMLTALDDDDSQMKGFDALADDYITKPFSMPVVMKHIEAVLRRAEQGGAAPNTVIRYKEITVDMDSLTVLVGTESVSLTTREFEILKLLLENQGRVVSRERLLDTPLERLIPQAEILLGEYGQRIQDAAERAYAAGRAVEHDVALFDHIFHRAGNGNSKTIEFGAFVLGREIKRIRHALLVKRSHRKRGRHVGYAYEFHILLTGYAVRETLTDNAVSRYANFYFCHRYSPYIS